jgi:hypothetical protein
MMVHTYQTRRCHNTEYLMVNRVLENRQSYIWNAVWKFRPTDKRENYECDTDIH